MRWRAVAFGLAVYAVVLLATAPATLLDAQLDHLSGGRLRLAAARGTIWSGAGELEALSADGRSGIARPLSWAIHPQSLLRGELSCEVTLGERAKRFPIAISGSGFRLARADIQLPAEVLGLAVPRLAPLELTGSVGLHVARLAYSGGKLDGSAVLQWRDAGSRLSPVSPLGDYALAITAGGRRVRITARTLRGPVRLDGAGTWVVGQQPAFSGTIRVLARDEPRLAPLLRLIAVEQAPRTFAVRLP